MPKNIGILITKFHSENVENKLAGSFKYKHNYTSLLSLFYRLVHNVWRFFRHMIRISVNVQNNK